MRKSLFLLSAAIVIAGAAPVAAPAAPAASLRLPPPKAPKDRIYSPGAIDKSLKALGFRVERMKRKGTTYAVTAVGKSGNRVQLTVDGRSGAIIGLAVLQAAPGQAARVATAVKSRRGSRYVDDSSPFGIIIPDIFQTRWTVVPNTAWTVYSVEYVPESWAYAGSGYRFAVPYYSIRPGHDGHSVTTFAASELGDPIYRVQDYEGTEIVTEYSEESVELSAAEQWEETYEAQEEQLEQSYLDGTIDEESDIDADEVTDYDSEDGDYDVEDDSDDGYDAGFDGDEDEDSGEDDEDEEDFADDEDEEGPGDDDADADDDGDASDDEDSGDYEDDSGDDDDDYEDDGGDEGYDDGGNDEPEIIAGR